MKALLKTVLERTPYRLVRRAKLNRFEALEDTLRTLAKNGLAPTLVVDGGAHTGCFTKATRELFPNAVYHLVEPQPACRPELEALVTGMPSRTILHPVALCSSNTVSHAIKLAAEHGTASTGAHVVPAGEEPQGPTVAVEGRTLDVLLGPHIRAYDRVLLKLDLQGYELEALRGAERTLTQTEAILTEVSFYAQAYEPSISVLTHYLSDRGFELYDVAALYARPRDNRARQGDFVFAKRGSVLSADESWS